MFPHWTGKSSPPALWIAIVAIRKCVVTILHYTIYGYDRSFP